MTKKYQTAFNRAFLKAIKKNKHRKLLYNKKTKQYDVMVPVAVVIASFRPFLDLVNKDLLKTPATANKRK